MSEINYRTRISEMFPEVTNPEELKELVRLRDACIHFYYPPTNSIYTISIIPMLSHRAWKMDETQSSAHQIRNWNGLPKAS